MVDNYEYKIDAKGRVFIPASMREDLGEVFYVTISQEHCLNAYSLEGWERFRSIVNELPMGKQPKMRPFFSNAKKCELDSQGRFVLPQKLRDRVGIDKEVTVSGMGTVVQFWDTESFRAINEQESTPENLADVMDELGI